MRAEDIYNGRKPKPLHRAEGGKVLRQATRQGGELPTVQKGSYDVKDAYLRGQLGGEANPNYYRTGRAKHNPASK